MDHNEFEKLVSDGYDLLPEWVREKISNVAVLIADEPNAEEREAQGLSDNETLLGLYKGVPLSVRGETYGVGMTLPDTITIYMLPTLHMAEDECGPNVPDATFKEHVRAIVADTIWHEFAHHFGMDEAAVHKREVDRRNERVD